MKGVDNLLPGLTRTIDRGLREATGKPTGFVLLVFEFNEPGPARICSNVSGEGIQMALQAAIKTIDLSTGEPLETTH